MKLYAFIFTLFLGQIALAQEEDFSIPESKRAEIESKKIGYLTNKLELTPEEAQVFWPVYNAYQNELEEHRQQGIKELRAFRESFDELDSETILNRLEQRFEHERKRLAIEEEYFEKMSKVLSARKLAKLYQAEKDFKRELLRRVVDDRRRLMQQRREGN
jgi:hypothetical protein